MTGMPGNRDTAWLGRVLVLAVTTSLGNQVPTILLNQLDDFADLHVRSSADAHLCSRDNRRSRPPEKYTTTSTPLQRRCSLPLTRFVATAVENARCGRQADAALTSLDGLRTGLPSREGNEGGRMEERV